MDDKRFQEIAKTWQEEKLKEIKPFHKRTENCLYFQDVENYVKEGETTLSFNQREHIETCPYCKRIISAFNEIEKPPRPSVKEILLKAFNKVKETVGEIGNVLKYIFSPQYRPILAPVITIIFVFLIFAPLLTPPLQLESYSVVPSQLTIKTRGGEIITESAFKIQLITNHNAYAYLFEIKKGKVDLLTREKVLKRTTLAIPSAEQTWIQKEGKLILVLSKNPLKDIPAIQEIILKNQDNNEKEISELFKKLLKTKDILVKFL